MRYIALLRGVNVGGNNIIAMPALRAAFEQAGFTDVRTYINSGNVLFTSDGQDAAALQAQCRRIILDAFGLSIVTAVLSAEDLEAALLGAPAWWDDDAQSKHNAIFVIAPMAAAAVIQGVGEAKPEYEKIASHGQVIFWSAPIKTFSRTRWAKVVSAKALYNSITIRNANTAKKLLQLVREE